MRAPGRVRIREQKDSDTPGAVESSVPEPGEHNASIYAGIGLGEADLQALAEEKVI
ncbi:MAG: hypothetical protein HPY65_17895 [Syntrophaceae bacterium]|nr:hypothetical protein [Syntrophaceae bacterium]